MTVMRIWEEEEEEEEEEDSVPVLVTMTPDEYRNKMLSEHENEVNKQPKAKNGHGKASAPGTTDAGGASSESDIDPHRMRFNYASLDAGAVVMASNPESERTWTLLNEDMDKYSISPCEVRKWVVIGLSEDVQIDSVVIANYERYSSTVKTFQLLGSHSYPVKEWMLLGEFEAKAVNGEQLFRLPKKAYARYLKFRFVKHHGSEFFCTLSLIRVYGSSMLESLREDLVESVQEVQKVQQKLDGKADLPSSDVEPEAELESEPKVEARDEVGNEEQAAAYPDPELDSEPVQGLEHEQVQEVESEPMSEQNADYSTQVERSVGASSEDEDETVGDKTEGGDKTSVSQVETATKQESEIEVGGESSDSDDTSNEPEGRPEDHVESNPKSKVSLDDVADGDTCGDRDEKQMGGEPALKKDDAKADVDEKDGTENVHVEQVDGDVTQDSQDSVLSGDGSAVEESVACESNEMTNGGADKDKDSVYDSSSNSDMGTKDAIPIST